MASDAAPGVSQHLKTPDTLPLAKNPNALLLHKLTCNALARRRNNTAQLEALEFTPAFSPN